MAHIAAHSVPPKGRGVSIGLIGLMGLISPISLMRKPYCPPPLGRGWGWVPDSYSLKNQDSSLLSHENVNLNQRNVLTGLPPKFSMNSRRRLCLYGNPTFKKKTCR